MEYLFIFIAELVEVLLFTLRIIYINRGEKLKGSIAAFLEITIWVYVINEVLDNVMQNPVKIFLFCVAFTLGNLLGTIIESKFKKK